MTVTPFAHFACLNSVVRSADDPVESRVVDDAEEEEVDDVDPPEEPVVDEDPQALAIKIPEGGRNAERDDGTADWPGTPGTLASP